MKMTFAIFMVSLFSAFFISLIPVDHALSQEVKIMPEVKIPEAIFVRVHHKHGIRTPNIKIKIGTTVVWHNESKNLMEIKFTNKQVTIVCSSPTNFIVDVDGTFVSNKIPPGGVASICFIEKGEFDYIAANASRTIPVIEEAEKFKGKIIVE